MNPLICIDSGKDVRSYQPGIISAILLSQWRQRPFPTLLSLILNFLTGITQERINEMRAAPEQVMICDIHDILATGQDLNRTDAQGATLVSETAVASLLPCFCPWVMKPALWRTSYTNSTHTSH